jgi:hypothetical protein
MNKKNEPVVFFLTFPMVQRRPEKPSEEGESPRDPRALFFRRRNRRPRPRR